MPKKSQKPVSGKSNTDNLSAESTSGNTFETACTSKNQRNVATKPMIKEPLANVSGTGKNPEVGGSTTSIKHRNFVSEPIGEKPVTALAGIGVALGTKLQAAGIDKASKVLGQFLFLKKDKQKFQEWLKETCNANSKQSHDCYQCLKDWCDAFLN